MTFEQALEAMKKEPGVVFTCGWVDTPTYWFADGYFHMADGSFFSGQMDDQWEPGEVAATDWRRV